MKKKTDKKKKAEEWVGIFGVTLGAVGFWLILGKGYCWIARKGKSANRQQKEKFNRRQLALPNNSLNWNLADAEKESRSRSNANYFVRFITIILSILKQDVLCTLNLSALNAVHLGVFLLFLHWLLLPNHLLHPSKRKIFGFSAHLIFFLSICQIRILFKI